MNQMMIMGHLGSDPEVRFTPSGQKVTTLRVATNQRRGGKEETLWWRVTLWGEQFDRIVPHLKKGSGVVVSGEMLKPEIYSDREGTPRVSLNLTAHHLTFNPFGRGDRQRETVSAGSGYASERGDREVGGAQRGEGGLEPGEAGDFSENDEEIPF